ncbi:site-specific integrase [Rhizobium leguminosarum]|uniref:site-specific integrase n=1 Tax=Rhizobium leguminosarum TaxID=384 RepID=UPI000371C83D|nr:site-specific integrase [Rhizobium leguminosarum]AVC49091.1 phage integrase family protein [Rhizobium leguminosarum bv. viciae]NKK47352.1 tyrosine-type recombinase/integrase [Rhizobium leguminosarum bv. viciae]TBZ75214.1 site-specific integrase [Rhizobium leguminosarum bv. viciae]
MDDMAKPPGLVQRGRIWYYRKRVPKDLVARYGKREIPISLDTEDYKTALGRFHEEAAKLEAEFTEIRRRREMFTASAVPDVPADVLTVSEEEAIAVARALVAERLANYDKITAKEKTPPPQDALEDLRHEISGDIGHLRDRGSEEADQLVYGATIDALKRNGYVVADRQRIDSRVLDLVRRALVVANQIELARIEGDFADNPGDVLFTGVSSADLSKVTDARKPKVSISSAIETFWDRVISLEPKAPKTEVKYKAILGVIKYFFGADTAIETVTRQQCFAFRDTIAKLPPNYAKKKDAPPEGASLDAVIEYARVNELPVMSYGTQALYIALMVRLFTWAGHERLTKDLVVVDIKPRGKRPAKDELRGSFDGEQLTAIFNAPIYRGCKDDEYGFSTPGPNIIKRSRYWVPLIALFAGMREGEILRLTADNVRVSENGTSYFDLSKHKGKNTYSRREVPVHSTLIKAGFLNFVEEKRKSKDRALFPDVPPGADGTQTVIFSKRFATFLRACGIKGMDAKTCFHMLRHTLKDALDRGQVPENYSEAIQGWSRRMKTSRSYGQGFEADTLKPWIEKAILPKFDLSHIIGEA